MSESKIKNIMAFEDKTITLNLSDNCFHFFRKPKDRNSNLKTKLKPLKPFLKVFFHAIR
jgi:hypothetical protein